MPNPFSQLSSFKKCLAPSKQSKHHFIWQTYLKAVILYKFLGFKCLLFLILIILRHCRLQD